MLTHGPDHDLQAVKLSNSLCIFIVTPRKITAGCVAKDAKPAELRSGRGLPTANSELYLFSSTLLRPVFQRGRCGAAASSHMRTHISLGAVSAR